MKIPFTIERAQILLLTNLIAFESPLSQNKSEKNLEAGKLLIDLNSTLRTIGVNSLLEFENELKNSEAPVGEEQLKQALVQQVDKLSLLFGPNYSGGDVQLSSNANSILIKKYQELATIQNILNESVEKIVFNKNWDLFGQRAQIESKKIRTSEASNTATTVIPSSEELQNINTTLEALGFADDNINNFSASKIYTQLLIDLSFIAIHYSLKNIVIKHQNEREADQSSFDIMPYPVIDTGNYLTDLLAENFLQEGSGLTGLVSGIMTRVYGIFGPSPNEDTLKDIQSNDAAITMIKCNPGLVNTIMCISRELSASSGIASFDSGVPTTSILTRFREKTDIADEGVIQRNLLKYFAPHKITNVFELEGVSSAGNIPQSSTSKSTPENYVSLTFDVDNFPLIPGAKGKYKVAPFEAVSIGIGSSTRLLSAEDYFVKSLFGQEELFVARSNPDSINFPITPENSRGPAGTNGVRDANFRISAMERELTESVDDLGQLVIQLTAINENLELQIESTEPCNIYQALLESIHPLSAVLSTATNATPARALGVDPSKAEKSPAADEDFQFGSDLYGIEPGGEQAQQDLGKNDPGTQGLANKQNE